MNKIFTFISLLTILLTSCQKEVSVDNGTTPTPTTNDSIYIKKVIALDTTKNAPFDTVYVTTYSYDNLKRVISNFYFEYNNTGHIDTSNFYYNVGKYYTGTDTLPFREITFTKEGNYAIRNTNYLTYSNTTSALIKDSTIVIEQSIIPTTSDTSIIVNKYVRQNNLIQRIEKTIYPNSTPNIDTFVYSLMKQNGNITSQQDNYYGSNTFTCSYDTKINPLARVNNYASFRHFGFLDLKIGDTDNDPTFYEQPNNVLEINNTSVGASNHYKYEYKYNTKNYPTEVTLKIISGGLFDKGINKIKYQYTN
jgi:hypothetical protein